MKPFQDYQVFQIAHQLTLDVHARTLQFPRHELFALTSQMRRAASSIPMNIAEGSVKSEREFRQALRVSLGSAAELEYQFMLARDLGYLPQDEYAEFTGRATQIRKMLTAFIRTIDRSLGAEKSQRLTTND
jgi:four helix bundle protein